MRHYDFLPPLEQDRLFLRAPEPFGVDADPDLLGVALGATLYCPAVRFDLARDVLRCAAMGVRSLVICLEDSVPDDDVPAAERNTVAALRDVARSGADQPMIFVRVRDETQIPSLVAALGPDTGALQGFVAPKFGEDSIGYLEATMAAAETVGRRLLLMPVLESSDIAFLETRVDTLLATRRLLDKYREIVPAIRVGATDLSGAYGLRRTRDTTVWDVRVVADVLSAVVNVFGRARDGAYVVTGPVWEYFSTAERLFKPQLRESPFAAVEERGLRAELIAADLDGLIREVALDRANGLTGKTVIHPTHVAAVHALSVVAHEEFVDAEDVLATAERGGAAASSYGNKMNESKPHTAWARRVMQRSRLFGVARPETSFVDLLGAGLHG